MSSDRTKTAAKAYFDAWNAHDAAAIVATFPADGTFWDNQMPAPVPATEARAGFEAFLKAVPDLRFDVAQLDATEDGHAVAEWRLRGTAQSGTSFDIPGVDVFEIADGRVRAARAYFNPASLSG